MVLMSSAAPRRYMGKKLYVGNLPFSATDEALQEIFAQAGNVQSAKIITDRDTGRSKGFGFVEMSSDQEAAAAAATAGNPFFFTTHFRDSKMLLWGSHSPPPGGGIFLYPSIVVWFSN